MESSVASSSTSTPPVLPSGEYEVFLSFRGPDVRKTFADHLYTSLSRAKIRTFRDDEHLQKGKQIASSLVRVIPESKIYIPILSEQYASSKWCLQELTQMVECCKLGKGHLILPIFYFVAPGDVRKQQGPYQEAFEQHVEEHSPSTVKEWKEALLEVGRMKGWHVTESDSQGAIVEKVLSKVESHLRSMYTLVTDELVGIDTHVEQVMELLNLGSSNEKVIVGIHGMGGVGKTTLSQAVYNKICAQFDRCCFLEDVRETLTKVDGAVSLQNKIISTILKKDDCQVKSVSEGISMMKERVCKHMVLLVVDDIDDNFEFDKILGKFGDFSSGSRFIFTTRYLRALDFLPNCRSYELGEMSGHYSLQLFSKHAFKMDNPPKEYAGISEDFVRVAAGLPLALKVIGSLVFRKEKIFWEEKLIELQEITSTTENKVMKSLKISYNDLTYKEQQIFLDIACFFIGSHKDLPYYMWSGCDFYPESGINTLMDRSLMKLDEESLFWMHDHLRDLGRAIVNEEDVRHPYNRSRIWSNDDALDMLRNREGKGRERVEALRVNVARRDVHEKLFENKEFENLSGLRYLEVHGGDMRGDFSLVLPNLCCLRLLHCGSIPTDICTKKLAVLDLEDSNVKDNWKGWNGIKAAAKLKAVNLPDCKKLTRAPDLFTCATLELINFGRCRIMEGQLHIGNFKKLKTLRLYWTKITGLIVGGNDIGKLQRLEEMDLRLTQLRELPAGMESLSSLKILLLESETGVSYRMEIPRLPGSLKRLTISTPSGVPNLLELKELESLSYVRASNPWIPGDLWQLPNLKEFALKQSPVYGPFLQQEQEPEQESTSPTALPSSLIRLHVEDCMPLTELPSLSNLRNLTQLNLWQFGGAAEIQGLGELRALEKMFISRSQNLKNLYGLENLLLLTTLSLQRCTALERLPSVGNLIKLKYLAVRECPVLVEIQDLGDLGESLSRLKMERCHSLANLDEVQLLQALDDFHFGEQIMYRHNIQFLQQFPDLSRLVNLKRLSIVQCRDLTQVTGLERLVSLEWLTIQGCFSIRQLPDLSDLRKLKTLELKECISLINSPTGIDRLESLQELVMSCCYSLTKLSNLSGLKNLEKLDLNRCTELTVVEGVEGLESLTTLQMYGCRSVKELGNLSGLKKLDYLNITGCTKLTNVDGLEELQDGLVVWGMGIRMRVKSAARYGKRLASCFLQSGYGPCLCFVLVVLMSFLFRHFQIL